MTEHTDPPNSTGAAAIRARPEIETVLRRFRKQYLLLTHIFPEGTLSLTINAAKDKPTETVFTIPAGQHEYATVIRPFLDKKSPLYVRTICEQLKVLGPEDALQITELQQARAQRAWSTSSRCTVSRPDRHPRNSCPRSSVLPGRMNSDAECCGAHPIRHRETCDLRMVWADCPRFHVPVWHEPAILTMRRCVCGFEVAWPSTAQIPLTNKNQTGYIFASRIDPDGQLCPLVVLNHAYLAGDGTRGSG